MNPLRILYDFEAFSDQSYGGISRYILELAKRIKASGDTEVHLAAGWHRNQYLKAEMPEWASGRFFPAWPKTGEIRRRLNALSTRRAIARFRPDIVHRTYHRHAANYPGSHSTVATIHDLTYFLYPDSFPGGEVVRIGLKKVAASSAHLLCDSNNTRDDAIRILGIARGSASVVHLGVNLPTRNPGPSPIKGNYLLFVGQRSGYKNFQGLVRNLARFRILESRKLALFGGGPLSRAERSELEQLGIANKIVQLAGGDQMLADAYAHATALVYPSLYEGFGLPILEAMAHGCLVVCSNRSSLPEVGGEAAIYFDPEDGAELHRAIELTVGSEQFRSGRSENGRRQASLFSWSQCADRTLSVYQKAVSPGKSD